ncbi:MAG: ABC transporter substrate binding protein [Betaproteobacteria bacterium]
MIDNRSGAPPAQAAGRRRVLCARWARAAWRATGIAALAAATAMTDGASAQRVFVLAASDAPPYQQALAGIRQGVGGLALDVTALTATNPDAMRDAIASAGRDVALVMLGTRASELAARAAPTAPVVNCMVTVDAAHDAPAAINVPLEVPLDAQLGWLRRLLPATRTVGLLFDPAINTRRIESLAPALARAGYAPLLAPVTSRTALPQALERLPHAVDALLAIPDATVYTPQASKGLLLFSFRNRIPLIGLSDAWVKAGALYALDWDYQELGGYCGALAAREVANGRPPPPPPRPRVIVNLHTAEQLHIKWDAELLRSVDRTYE